MPRKREMTTKITRKTIKYTKKAMNSEKPILMFENGVIVRMILGMKVIILKTMTIRRSM